MVNLNTLAELERLGFGSDIDSLESYIATLQDAAGTGEPLVSDALYDKYCALLKKLKPQSVVFTRNWEVEDNDFGEFDDVLKKFGMRSIQTITSYDEINNFASVIADIGHPVDIMASFKLNGHGVRAVYIHGRLYNGSTRGRYKKGRDITRHLKAVLPEFVDAWAEIDVVEVRGEMMVSIDNFNTHLSNSLKNPLSSVTSLIRDSASDSEIALLDMICYKAISSEGELKFDTLWDEFEHLTEWGFKTPQKALFKNVTASGLEYVCDKLLGYFEGLADNGDMNYLTDGIVVSINDSELFYESGLNKNTWNGNIALKMGKYWGSNIYSAVIEQVVWIPGKSYLTPKALIQGVVTSNGAEVTTVPLYNIGVMERYGYTPGKMIYFKFGGEQGVTLTDSYGDSVSLT